MTRYGSPACNGIWEEKDEAIAHCFDSRRNEEVFRCPCGQYRNCNLTDFIAKHMEGCNEGKAVLEGGLWFTNRGRRQNVILHCSRRKSDIYPSSPTEIEEEAEEEGTNEVTQSAFPAMSAPAKTLPAPPPRVLEEQQRPTKRRRIEHSTRVPEQSPIPRPSRLPPAMVPATGTSMQSQLSATHANSVSPSASLVTLASLGLPAPGPALSSLIGQDANHMPFDDLFNNVIASPPTAAPSNVPDRKNNRLHSRPNREFSAQVNAPTAPNDTVDLTNDDDAPSVVSAMVDASNRSGHERPSQVNAAATRICTANSGFANTAGQVTAHGGRRKQVPSTRAPVTGEQAVRALRTVPASPDTTPAVPTAEELENAMPLSRYGPLGVPRKVKKKTNTQ
ncbi:hypothetical protein HII31_05339 [Pseudocercospora fuligena]|uniref:Uncharacterized protein n=1 Tax=Pseudocercospora fuligena TaxID=685502 RepID=A0A8H6VIZ3_9PEZI|nr:hypothetical protein HII31_05339 [Pseudocercospora fuligena]